ncbi:MAG: dTDP-4-dehydrorhamnose reductase [Sterolibacteriaceae bacterium MAG5]|nr:dTDP-4-dehydrorhamnose reductase [Candidatus Nitricoxidireducens bremensis]
MKRILLTGRCGQVGWELERSLSPLGQVFACDHAALDLTNPDRIRERVRELKPDLVVNAAAYTAVDQAETEPELALAVNGIAPGVLAEEAKRLGALLVHYSTDYVFDGTKPAPYTEADIPNPINVYGRSKLAGEQAIREVGGEHLILRTSWVYGLRGRNFLLTMMRLAAERPLLRVVADQVGAPTWCRSIAETTAALLARGDGPRGLFHLAAGGETSWHGFAAAIVAALGATATVERIATDDYPLPARRPANSRLDCAQLRKLDIALPAWESQLALCLDDR